MDLLCVDLAFKKVGLVCYKQNHFQHQLWQRDANDLNCFDPSLIDQQCAQLFQVLDQMMGTDFHGKIVVELSFLFQNSPFNNLAFTSWCDKCVERMFYYYQYAQHIPVVIVAKNIWEKILLNAITTVPSYLQIEQVWNQHLIHPVTIDVQQCALEQFQLFTQVHTTLLKDKKFLNLTLLQQRDLILNKLWYHMKKVPSKKRARFIVFMLCKELGFKDLAVADWKEDEIDALGIFLACYLLLNPTLRLQRYLNSLEPKQFKNIQFLIYSNQFHLTANTTKTIINQDLMSAFYHQIAIGCAKIRLDKSEKE